MASKKVKPQTYEEFLDEFIRHIHLNETEDGLDSDDYNYLLADLKEFVENQVKLHQPFKERRIPKSFHSIGSSLSLWEK